MTAINLLVGFLVGYTLLGGAHVFNLWHINDRWAHWYARLPGILNMLGADNPLAYRAGGLVIFSSGAIVLAWMLLQTTWNLPTVDRGVGVAALTGTAIAAVPIGIWVIRRRTR